MYRALGSTMTTSNFGFSFLRYLASVVPEAPPPTTTQRGPLAFGRSAGLLVRPVIAAEADPVALTTAVAAVAAASAEVPESFRN